ncbi:MAG TPA: methyltransferase domain-containing protein [Pyrinomonadaceae bacterium]|jgi:predicted SAM-dependent methyltransferase
MKITTRIAYSLFPSYVWGTLREELKLTRCRWKARRRVDGHIFAGSGYKLHLGSGPRVVPGWFNIDGAPQDQLDLQWDLRTPLPFANRSCRLIYSEHLLEHLFKEDALNLLQECNRLLEPGGSIRLGVPDAELYLRAYVERRTDFFQGLKHLGGAVIPLSTPIDVINQMFRMGGAHLFAWDFETIERALVDAGFTQITRWPSGQASSPELCLDDPEHAFETLYVEAVKPGV